ncbi:DNA-3-methyladenine glycosylase I [Paraoerskovia sediminicola]|nr:DNA-3-methyladenine glycosylase I [Paraoerskovia sediminicola]
MTPASSSKTGSKTATGATDENPPAAEPDEQVAGRCFGDGDPLYAAYHDDEWGVPVHGEAALFERIALEGFQSGLSWLTVLRKRPAFREVFADFDPRTVAGFGEDDVTRLLADGRIIRNRAKIEATIGNARALVALNDAGTSLDELFWSYAPDRGDGSRRASRPATWQDVPATSDASTALSKDLKKRGFRFVGPTTMYAAMQACGLVDDHLATCPVVTARA